MRPAAAQMEINFNHGDALVLADQAFLFKRTVRQAAMRHNIYATFMAKPLANEPGSSMHIHQSLLDRPRRAATCSPTRSAATPPSSAPMSRGCSASCPR